MAVPGVQAVDAAHADDALHLSQLDACHGVVGVRVRFGQPEKDFACAVEVIFCQELGGLLLALCVLDEVVWLEGRATNAVGESWAAHGCPEDGGGSDLASCMSACENCRLASAFGEFWMTQRLVVV